jgi:hypothetical protein
MFKKCKIVMLPTNKRANILYIKNKDKSYLRYVNSCNDGFILEDENYKGVYQNLFILSDDEPVDGDNVIPNNLENPFNRSVYIFMHSPCPLPYWGTANTCKKVIAATGSSIHEVGDIIKVPLISQSFIKHFVSEYNKGNKIEDIIVEYEKYIDVGGKFPEWNYPKLNIKNYTIIVHKIKNSFTRDEVYQLIRSFSSYKTHSFTSEDIKWIKDNL